MFGGRSNLLWKRKGLIETPVEGEGGMKDDTIPQQGGRQSKEMEGLACLYQEVDRSIIELVDDLCELVRQLGGA